MGFFKKHGKAIVTAAGMLGLVVVGLVLLAASFLADLATKIPPTTRPSIPAGTITDDDRVTEAFDTHLIDPEVTEIRGGLGVVELSLPRTGSSHTEASISQQRGGGEGSRR